MTRWPLQRMIAGILLGMALVVATAWFEPALAQGSGISGFSVNENFSCAAGGQMLQGTGSCPSEPSFDKMFSYFVCHFEKMLNEILSEVYCGIVKDAQYPVMAALTLALTLFGAFFLMGMVPFTAKETMVMLGKFSLVYVFALKGEYMIGIGYNLFVTGAKDGIEMVLRYVFDEGFASGGDVYRYFDQLVAEVFSITADAAHPESQCENYLFAFIVLLAAVFPPVFMLAVYMFVKFLWIIVRAVVGYCLGLLGITFLITLGPIFVSFALFKPTRTLFDKWVQYLFSFAFQMVVVFAFIGMILSIAKQAGEDFKDYASLVRPYNAEYRGTGFSFPWQVCGICELNEGMDPPTCASDEAIPPTALMQNEEFMELVSVKVIALLVLAYILDIMMDYVPVMARQLAGPRYAGQLGGGRIERGEEGIALNLPGQKPAEAIITGFSRGYGEGWTTPGAVVRGIGGALDAALTAVPASAAEFIANPQAGNTPPE